MIAFLQDAVGPYYIYIKFVHLLFVMLWIWSTSVAFAFYLVPVFKAWRRSPQDEQIVTMRNWVMERFDHGVIYEHVAFPIVLLTGLLLWVVGGWTPTSAWFVLKLLIIVGIFLPIEIFDYYLAHLGGNKRRLRRKGDPAAYERGVRNHWLYLVIVSPAVMVFAVLVVFLTVTKPF